MSETQSAPAALSKSVSAPTRRRSASRAVVHREDDAASTAIMDPVAVLKAYADQRGLVDPFVDEYAENAWKSFQDTKQLPAAGTARASALACAAERNRKVA